MNWSTGLLSRLAPLSSAHLSRRLFRVVIYSLLALSLTSVLWLSERHRALAWVWFSRRFRQSTSARTRATLSKPQLERWIRNQTALSFQGILAAVGPDGSNAPQTSPGILVASPSRPGSYTDPETENENYFFHWVRDAGLCLRVILRKLQGIEPGDDDVQGRRQGGVAAEGWDRSHLETVVHQSIELSSKLQLASNACGGPTDGGLGEPKFNVDGSSFNEPWGRPQNDGPAVRASTMLRYARHLVQSQPDPQSGLELIQSLNLYRPQDSHSIIRLDIDHVQRTWRQPTFDLWEEVQANNGGHFYTLMVQRKAVQDFVEFLELLPSSFRPASHEIAAYESCLREMKERLEEFWNPKGLPHKEGGPGKARNDNLPFCHQPHIVPTLDRLQGQPKPSQADTAVLLAINHTAGPSQPTEWSPGSDRVLATLDRLVRIFEKAYPLNAGKAGRGIAMGRYPEDEYDGINANSHGHPWFLCTHAVVEVAYLAINELQNQPSIAITEANLPFFSRFLGGLELPMHLQRGEPQFCEALRCMKEWADTFLVDVAWRYCDRVDGNMSEQIDRVSGRMRGARELTWSYASFVTAIEAREGKAPN